MVVKTPEKGLSGRLLGGKRLGYVPTKTLATAFLGCFRGLERLFHAVE